MEKLIGVPVSENESMQNYTTFKIGGPAKYFLKVDNSELLQKAVAAAQQLGVPFFILGGGSNVLVSDNGIDGLVLKLVSDKLEINDNRVTAFAGYNLNKLIRDALEQGLGGLEFAGNVPGTIGGAVWGNAGAYGKGVGDFVRTVDALVPGAGGVELKTLTRDECKFAYRDSIFKHEPTWIIASVTLEMEKVLDQEARLTAINAEQQDRIVKQPLDCPSAGCTFKNLIFSEEMENLKQFETQGKVPAARLIDSLGLKGTKIGGAMISDKHANFIINTGNAKASDIVQLISLVKTKVRDSYNVQLEEEVQFLGF